MADAIEKWAEAEAMLRKHAAMYGWSKTEARAINDFILTVRFGVQEDMDAAVARLTEARAAGERDRHALTKALEFAWGWGGHDKECPIGINVNAPDTTLCTCGYDERADELMDLEEACGLDFWTNSRAALSARRPTETGGKE